MNYIKLQKQLRIKHALTFTDKVDRIFAKVNDKVNNKRVQMIGDFLWGIMFSPRSI